MDISKMTEKEVEALLNDEAITYQEARTRIFEIWTAELWGEN